MEYFSTSELLVLCGLILGVVMGATARYARFCTFGAVEDYILIGKTNRLKSWVLAIAVAMILVQLLHHFDLARIDETFYLNTEFGLLGAIVGGLLFGLGMAMVGTCGYGTIIRAAGGDLKAVCNFLILGVIGYMTARGLLSVVRNNAIDRFDIKLTTIKGQGIPDFVSSLIGTNFTGIWLATGCLLSGALFIYCFRDKAFRDSRRDVIAGLLIGLCVAGGFLATGWLGADPFNETDVRSISYVLPLGETLIWLMTYSGATITFPVAIIIGTFFGAFFMAFWLKELRWESFDDIYEMRRHMLGAAAMGAGGITAHGCTIGQGISGVSTLAVSPMIALVSIFIGATFGLHWLLTGNVKDAWSFLIGSEGDSY